MPEIVLERIPLQDMAVDAVAYGAKDTGEMGGGAAASVLAAAGPDLLPALRQALAQSTRQIGDAVLTEGFRLKDQGVRWILHVISILKHTPEGAWCPHPEKLYDGVSKALQLAQSAGARSIAFSMLATGEGRVTPEDAARLMVRAMRDFQRSTPGALEIAFSLPTYRDYQAVQAVVARSP